MNRARWFAALTTVAGLGTGCLMPTVEEEGARLGIAWDCQTGTPEEIATCKSDYSKRFPGQRKFESAASWRHMWRDQLLESARSGDARQVIEESDIFKVEGTTMYALNPYRGLFVIDITNVDQPRILAREPVYGHAEDMYVRGGRAYIMFNDYYRWDYGDEAFQGAQVVIVAIEDAGNGNNRRVSTEVVGQYGLDGYLTDSRLVYEDGGQNRARLYVISNDTRYEGRWWDEDDSNGSIVNNTHILSLNVTDPSNIREADRLTVDGAGHVVTATTDYIFVGSQDWATQKSQIQIINIQDRDGDIAPGATVEVDGYIRHRFDMDFRAGRLRVVSHDWSWDPEEGSSGDIHVTTYDAANMMTKGHQLDLVGVGSLEATRFADDRVYLVHVQRIDPIEIIDLSNPAELKSIGELEIPGWLEHLEIRGDTVLGVGYDQGNTTVPQRRCEGYTLDGQPLAADAAFPEVAADTQKISLSAYDVTDPAALCEASRTRFGVGDWPYGNFGDDKTLRLYDTDADGVDDLFLIPWESYDDEATEGANQQINALSLVDVAYGAGVTARVNARGRIDSMGSIERAFPARGRLITLGDRELIVANIADRDHPAVTARLEMARNVQAFATVGQFGVQLVSDYDSPAAELRVVSLSDPDAEKGAARSTIQLVDEQGKKIEAEELYTSGRIVTVVGREWKYNEFDDNNDGETDRWEDNFEVRFTNYQVNNQGRISFGGTLALPLVTDGGAAQKFADLRDIIRLRPDMFVVTAPDGLFRAVSTKNAVPTVTHVEPAPYGAYGIEDLRTFDGNNVYAVTWQPVTGRVEEAQQDVTLGTRDANGNLTKARRRVRPRAERVAYFVTKVTLNAQGVPTNARYRINVPGRLIDVATANGQETWTLLDSRWRTDQDNFRQERAMFTVAVTPLHATLLDGAQIGSGVEDVRVVSDGGHRAAYLVDNDAWSGPIVPLNADGTAVEQDTRPHLIILDLSNPEAVIESARMQLPGHYAYMREVAQFGARRYAFLSLGWGGGMSVVDVTNGSTPVMDQFVRSNGGVWEIQVNAERNEVYFAAGMFGVQSVRVGQHSGAN